MAAQVEQPVVYVGALDPEVLAVVVTATTSLPDLTVVTAVEIVPIYKGARLAAWACDITEQSAKTLTVVHPFQAGDLSADRIGAHTLEVRLTTPDGVRRCAPKALIVREYRATL